MGHILTPVYRRERVDSEKAYSILGAHWYAQGLYTKDVKTGAEIRADDIYRVKEGDFVYNRLFAWKGSFAIAKSANNNCYVSNEFPCFSIDASKVDPRYLERYFSLPSTWNEALGLSSGSTPTSRNRLKEEQLLTMTIYLPPLDEQRRIIARIEEIAAHIDEARIIRNGVSSDIHAMLLGAYDKIVREAPQYRLEEVAPLYRRSVDVDLEKQYHELGIRSFGKGTFHKPAISGADLGTKRVFWLEPGDLVFNIVFAWEGAVAVVKPEDSGRVGSHRFLACVPRKGLATAHFLWFHFMTDKGLRQLGEASPGGAGRNRTLGLKALANIEVPVPAYPKQIWFDQLYAKVGALQTLQAETQAELDALLPAVLDKAFKGEL